MTVRGEAPNGAKDSLVHGYFLNLSLGNLPTVSMSPKTRAFYFSLVAFLLNHKLIPTESKARAHVCAPYTLPHPHKCTFQ